MKKKLLIAGIIIVVIIILIAIGASGNKGGTANPTWTPYPTMDLSTSTSHPTRTPLATNTPTPVPPKGATALCWDNTYSFSQHTAGTCSGHNGVRHWFVIFP